MTPNANITQFPDGEPQSHAVYQQILHDIQNGLLQPGERLRETELAARLGVSRTPVREALRLLEIEGLVHHPPRQGAKIHTLEYSEITSLYEMRAILEGAAARFAARTATAPEIDNIRNLHVEFTASQNDKAALNRKFHEALLLAAKNSFLTRSMEVLRKSLLLLGPTTLADQERANMAEQEHVEILEALANRDEDGAEAAMRAHIHSAQTVRLRNYLEHNPKKGNQFSDKLHTKTNRDGDIADSAF